MAATTILAPFTAVRLAWAIAGKISSEPESKLFAQEAEQLLKEISKEVNADSKEQAYVAEVQAAVQAAVRSLKIIYKGRQLNFEENEKLREAYMENVKDGIQFGSKAKDFLKALPTMAVVGPGVAGTLGPMIVGKLKVAPENQSLFLWGLGVAMAGLGYLVHLGFVRWARKRTQMLYVKQDYERNLYYDQYIARVKAALTGLYRDIDRLHKQTFGVAYPVDEKMPERIIEHILEGVESTMCKFIHEHMRKKIITPEVWTLCEVGEPRSETCPYWRK